MREIIYRESYILDYQGILEYIESNFGKIYTMNLYFERTKVESLLALFPEIGREKRIYKKHVFSFGHNHYIYEFNKKKIIFIGLIDTRRSLEL